MDTTNSKEHQPIVEKTVHACCTFVLDVHVPKYICRLSAEKKKEKKKKRKKKKRKKKRLGQTRAACAPCTLDGGCHLTMPPDNARRTGLTGRCGRESGLRMAARRQGSHLPADPVRRDCDNGCIIAVWRIVMWTAMGRHKWTWMDVR